MSIMSCTRCGWYVDTDFDTDSLYVVDDECICEGCREQDGINEMYQALSDLVWLGPRDGELPNERFERIGERFYSECGMLRPGKSQSDALMGTPSQEERRETFDAWLAMYYTRARKALAKARGEKT